MKRPRSEELLEAYVSGAGLSDEERSAVEALIEQSPVARRDAEATRDLLDALRAAAPEPPAASEAVVRAVRIACATPAPWPDRARAWLRQRWTVALPFALALAGTIAVVALRAGPEATGAEQLAAPSADVTPPVAPAAPAAVWLDGETAELDALDADATAAIDRELAAALDALDGAVLDDADAADALALDGILPAIDLGWVDQLDDADAAELERWLAEQPS